MLNSVVVHTATLCIAHLNLDNSGNNQDKKNMHEILEKWRTVKKSHRILMLANPNSAGLNITLVFCLKGLLAHLHRGATKNFVYGFKN